MNIFKKIIFIFLVSSTTVFASSQYWLQEEYEKLYPVQKSLSQQFNQQVQKSAVPLQTTQKEPVKIVMVYPGNQISDYWRRSKASFEKRLKELNIDYTLIDYFTKPAALKAQSRQLLKAIKDDTDYLIFTLDIKKHSKFIERIISNQKPKLILQNITTPLKKWGDKQPFFYVGFDHVTGSKMLADYYLKTSHKKGKYALLYGTNGYVSSMRGDSFIRYMHSKSRLQLVDSYYTNFDKQRAIQATREILKQHQDLEFIYAASTDIALGVIEVLKEKNLIGQIQVNGWGGGSLELEAIEEKLLDVTVMRMNDDNGVAMAEAIKLDLQGQTGLVPQIYSGDFQLVKKGIHKQSIEAYKKRAFRYSE